VRQIRLAWDIGVDDAMATWCFQVYPDHIDVVDYYEGHGMGFDHYCEWLDARGTPGPRLAIPASPRARGIGPRLWRRLLSTDLESCSSRSAWRWLSGGDAAAMRLVMERLLPAPPPAASEPLHAEDKRGLRLDRRGVGTHRGGSLLARSLQVRPHRSVQLVANTAKAVETFELADRLARLEERISAKGSNP
jgi:hypothetical protein